MRSVGQNENVIFLISLITTRQLERLLTSRKKKKKKKSLVNANMFEVGIYHVVKSRYLIIYPIIKSRYEIGKIRGDRLCYQSFFSSIR